MSREWKAKRAKQARTRRAKQKASLVFLKQKASRIGATKEVKTEYLISLKKRRAVLDYDKQRIAKRRSKLKTDIAEGICTAVEKAEKLKKTTRLYYTKSKVQGKEKNWKAAQRARKLFDMIKSKIESEGKDINSRCMHLRRSKMTPLAAAVKYCNPEAVSYLLERKASPARRCTSTLTTTPLYDAAWKGKSKIAQLLLEKSGLPDGGITHGALHGAIQNKMFHTIKIMLNQGCRVNEHYLEQTPLGAALTCGKRKSGDARLVAMLLAAKADLMKKTLMSHSPFFHAPVASHFDLARKYSNKRCQLLLQPDDKKRVTDESGRRKSSNI